MTCEKRIAFCNTLFLFRDKPLEISVSEGNYQRLVAFGF
jgi:hypothetical protein